MLTVELIRRGARYFPKRTAVYFEDKSLTFAEVDRLSNRFAHALSRNGINRGGRLAILANNSLYTMPVDFACVRSGAARTPLNARLSMDEHEHMLRDTGARVVIYDAELAERAEVLRTRIAGLTMLGLGSNRCGADLLVEAMSEPETDPQVHAEPGDVILTVFTSGTTGRLKAAEHTQSSYAAMCNNLSANLPDISPDDVMYLNAPDLNASTFIEGGWLRTRDVGRFDEEGYLYLVDRTSDMIITGGYNVYPREVEDALLAHPLVLECAVVGAPHEKWVEAVTAFVVLRTRGVATGETTGNTAEVAVANELIEFTRERLASYKVPKSIHFIDAIPRSAVGKLLRRALRDSLWTSINQGQS